MNFWERVDWIIDNLDINRKTLAAKVGIDHSTIGKGIRRKSAPSADTAVKIAKCLHTSVEYLVTGKVSLASFRMMSDEAILFRKYEKAIRALERMPPKTRSLFMSLAEEWDAE